MKTIKSALLGSKHLIDTNQDALLFQVKEILKNHRALIITRLIGDIPTYLDYKFSFKANKKQLEEIKEMLINLKNSSVDLSMYDSVVRQVLVKAVTHLTNEPFFVELDQVVEPYTKEKRLNLA